MSYNHIMIRLFERDTIAAICYLRISNVNLVILLWDCFPLVAMTV